ncbi:MAG: efflux RND transporter periplasmic adaptor subunit [Deltaproteobacteria bacterium]|nr:efflux RND transporter periplasmic adaptor subunit [Deltaproteobacteria bacterium]
MVKRLFFTAVGLVALLGAVAGIKALQIRRMIDQGSHFVPPPETVTTAEIRAESWESVITAVGSLAAVRGVTVSAEVPGKVARIGFEGGGRVRAGDLLVQLDTASEDAQLPGAEAAVALARRDLARADELQGLGIITVADHDGAVARARLAQAQVDDLRAARAKKAVRAPFTGRLGLRLVNLGQVLNAGEPIVSLQALDPIFADFLLPQQELAQVKLGQTVRLTSDALPGELVTGRVSAIDPAVDASTRSVRVQATVPNPGERLRPGLYVTVAVVLPGRRQVLTVPATAILYAPYGDSVFVVEGTKSGEGGRVAKGLVLRQQVVKLGEKRGDFASVTSGLSAGAVVATTGVFKLRNGQAVVVDNSLAPPFQLAPRPREE